MTVMLFSYCEDPSYPDVTAALVRYYTSLPLVRHMQDPNLNVQPHLGVTYRHQQLSYTVWLPYTK